MSYFKELRDGVYLASQDYMIEDQKEWGDEDALKTFDFTKALF